MPEDMDPQPMSRGDGTPGDVSPDAATRPTGEGATESVIAPLVQLAASRLTAGIRPDAGKELRGKVDKYAIYGEIARGGVGVVVRGLDERIGREVALKFLRDDRTDESIRHRFIEEAQIAGQLQHPGIVPVYDLGLLDEKPFFSMKLIKGRTFSEVLADRSEVEDDARRCLGIFEQVCHTMAYAHAHGVIHRDLKPANIMVGAFGEVLVVDWGMGKVLHGAKTAPKETASAPVPQTIIATARSGDDSSQSIEGSILGTPAYMPPEQARGEIDDLDERADVFSLGAILCEMLTGEPPFLGTDNQMLLYQSAHGLLDGAIERIDGSGADGDLRELAKDCLAADRTDRPRDAAAVADRVQAHLAAVEQKAQEARIKVVAAKRTQKLLGAIGVIVAAACAVSLVLWRRAENQREIADVERSIAQKHRGKAVEQHRLAEQARVAAERARFTAERQRGIAEEQRVAAEKAKSALLERNEKLEAIAYASRLRQAQEAIAACRPAGVGALLDAEDERHRGFAWKWLRARADPKRPRLIRPGRGPLHRVEWSPGGASLLAGHGGFSVMRFTLRQGNGPVEELTQRGLDAAFSPDGTRIVTVTHPSTLTVWDARTRRTLAATTDDAEWTSACFSPDGRRVAAGSAKGAVLVAAAHDLSEIHRFDGYDGVVRAVSFSPDGARLLIAGHAGTAQILDAESGRVLQRFRYYRGPVREWVLAARFSPDGRLVLLAGAGGRASLWDAADGTLLHELEPHKSPHASAWEASTADFTPDGRFALTGGRDRVVRVHSVATGRRVGAYFARSSVLAARVDSTGSRFVVGCEGGEGLVWTLDSLHAPLELIGHAGPLLEVRVTSDGRAAFSAAWDGVRKWDLATGQQLFAFPANLRQGGSLDLSPDERSVAVGGREGRIWILDATDGRVLRSFAASIPQRPSAAPVGITRLRFHRGGRILAVAPGTWSSGRPNIELPVLIFDPTTGALVTELRGHRATVAALAFSPDGEQLASSGYGGKLFLWKTDTWEQSHDLSGTGRVSARAAVFDHSGATLFVGLGNGRLAAYAVADGRRRWAIHPHHGSIMDISLDSTGRRFLISGTGRNASVWDTRFHERLLTFPLFGWTAAARFAPGDDRVLLGGRDGFVRCYEIEPPSGMFAKRSVTRRAAIRVKELSASIPLVADVRSALALDKDLDEPVRVAALAIVAGMRDDWDRLNQSVWRVLEKVDVDAAAVQRALREARAAAAVAQPHQKGLALGALGGVLFRSGEHAAAIATLQKADRLVRELPEFGRGVAGTHALLALAHHALGDEGATRAAVEAAWTTRLRKPREVELTKQAAACVGVRYRSKKGLRPHDPRHATGPPDTVPDQENQNRFAWVANGANVGRQWLELEYAEAVHAEKVLVYEVKTPGALVEIIAIDEGGKQHSVWKGKDPMTEPGLFAVDIAKTEFRVKRIRVVLETRGWNHIDTVGLVDAKGFHWPVRARASSTLPR